MLWQIKNDTLTGSFGFVGSKNGFTTGKSIKDKAIFRTYKSNENTTDLCVKLLKTNERFSCGMRIFKFII
jgi:hypothetical protein